MRATFLAAVAVLMIPLTAFATTLAYDDAADPVYSSGPYHSLNGAFGFNAWAHSPPAFPAGSGGPLHAYVSSSAANDPIGPALAARRRNRE